ncbi:hypothetical protein Bca101_008605 [Brassica carinata]
MSLRNLSDSICVFHAQASPTRAASNPHKRQVLIYGNKSFRMFEGGRDGTYAALNSTDYPPGPEPADTNTTLPKGRDGTYAALNSTWGGCKAFRI